MPPPESWMSSMNSPIGGMSSFSICPPIILVAIHDMPGIALQCRHVQAGVPTVATLTFAWRSFRIASSPKNVKKRSASIPSMRAPLAMISAG